MPIMKIYIFSPNVSGIFSENLLEKIRASAEVVIETQPRALSEVAGLYEDTSEKLLAIDPDFFNWDFPTKEALEKIPSVKGICLATTSFSWLDVKEASERGVPVTNLRGFSTEAVAEYVLMMTLSVARKMPLVIKDGYAQDFVKHQGIELKGKTAAIIGLGRIGTRIGGLMQGVGMNVVYWSKHSSDDRFEKRELAEMFRTADVIFPTMAQNDETKGLITDEMLKSMKPASMLVSIAHKIYNHELLLELVKTGAVYGYAFEGDNEDPRKYEGNVFASPAIAWATGDSMRLNGEMWTNSLLEALDGNFPTKIN